MRYNSNCRLLFNIIQWQKLHNMCKNMPISIVKIHLKYTNNPRVLPGDFYNATLLIMIQLNVIVT